MKTKTVIQQSLFDLAIQMGGSVESVFDLALNNELSITGEIMPGYDMNADKTTNEQIIDYYRIKNITPATSIIETHKQGGIGYMAIGIDFIVS